MNGKQLIAGCLVLIVTLSIIQFNPVYASGITRVQCGSNSAVTGSSFTVTLSSIPVDGNALILSGGRLSGGTISNVASTGASWSAAISKADGQNEAYATIWYALNVSGAGNVVTVSLSNVQFGDAATICEYSGIASSNALDVTASNANHGGRPQTVDSGTTGTTNNANELYVASLTAGNGIGYDSNVFSGTPNGSGFSSASIVADGAYEAHEYVEKIVSLTGTAGTGDSFGGGNSQTIYWAGVIATFKASGPLIHLNPTSGSSSSMVTVTGSNFNIADTCSSPASTTSNPTGLIGPISSCSFSAGTLSLVFQVAPSASVGSYIVTITGSALDSASASFTVMVSTVTATVTVTSTSVASTVTTTPTVTASTVTVTPTVTASTTTITPTVTAATVTVTPTTTVTLTQTVSTTVTTTSILSATATQTITVTVITSSTTTSTHTATVTKLTTVSSTSTHTNTSTKTTVTYVTTTRTSTRTATTTTFTTTTHVSTRTVTVTTTTTTT